MTEQSTDSTEHDGPATSSNPPSGEQGAVTGHVVVIGPDGQPTGTVSAAEAGLAGDDGEAERSVAEMVEQPAKVMRIGTMIKQLLDEVKAAPLDEASRNRLKEIHQASIKELESGLAPELVEELERLSLPFTEETPSDGELRIAQAQLVGWLEGLFHGIQTAMYAQQMAAQAQMEAIRRGLPRGGDGLPGAGGSEAPEAPQASSGHEPGGLYL